MIDKFNFFFSGNKQRVKHIPIIRRRSGRDEIANHHASIHRQRSIYIYIYIYFFFGVKWRSVFEFSHSLRFHTRKSLTDERVNLFYHFFLMTWKFH